MEDIYMYFIDEFENETEIKNLMNDLINYATKVNAVKYNSSPVSFEERTINGNYSLWATSSFASGSGNGYIATINDYESYLFCPNGFETKNKTDRMLRAKMTKKFGNRYLVSLERYLTNKLLKDENISPLRKAICTTEIKNQIEQLRQFGENEPEKE